MRSRANPWFGTKAERRWAAECAAYERLHNYDEIRLRWVASAEWWERFARITE